MKQIQTRMRSGRFSNLWLSSIFIGLLALLCAVLALVQNRWIYEISLAERDRLHSALQSDLNRLSRDFDRTIATSSSGLVPPFPNVSNLGSQAACSRQYQRWRVTNEPIFRRIGLVQWENGRPEFYLLNMDTAKFARAEWPPEWSGMRKRFEARMNDLPVPALPPPESALLEASLFGSLHGRFPWQGAPRDGFGPPPKEDWLVVELSLDYLRSSLLPDLFGKYLGGSGTTAYDTKIVVDSQPTIEILASTPDHRFDQPDASVGLLNMSNFEAPRGPRGEHAMRREWLSPIASNQPRWRLLVHRRGSSLESTINSARLRNIALSGGILLLILTTVVASLRYSRRSQQFAALQMNFVAGVSHELRTPLTVIRTAAFNLRGRLATRPDQVEKYAKLIQNESEKLTVLVDQVLRYGAASAGHVIGERRPIGVEGLIDSSIKSSSAVYAPAGVVIEKRIDPGLPVIFADELALKHALQNLVDNAVKYGLEGSGWIGISAEAVSDGHGGCVEIRVTDHGPGIPADEQVHVFEAFYRGKRAVADQVHGTGLGLNLVRSIIEAHGGTIRVSNAAPRGAEFIVRIPAAPQGVQNVFANTLG
ncbi:MAG: sensor histidine kinase [Bryobacterales bacterium]|nr:sensor histidine kinase [Bryobacterales bacterium]